MLKVSSGEQTDIHIEDNIVLEHPSALVDHLIYKYMKILLYIYTK
jgi:hypothetical protein